MDNFVFLMNRRCVRLRMTPTTISQVLAHMQTLDDKQEESGSEDDDELDVNE